jgi:dUTP pyrophosphatase
MSDLLIKVLNPNAKLPRRGTEGAGGWDLFGLYDKPFIVKPYHPVRIPTGIALTLPEGTVGLVRPRSSAFGKGLLVNGTIDSDYTGEAFVVLINLSPWPVTLEPGIAYAQLIITKYEVPELKVVEELPQTKRGDKGFGHTSGK